MAGWGLNCNSKMLEGVPNPSAADPWVPAWEGKDLKSLKGDQFIKLYLGFQLSAELK